MSGRMEKKDEWMNGWMIEWIDERKKDEWMEG